MGESKVLIYPWMFGLILLRDRQRGLAVTVCGQETKRKLQQGLEREVEESKTKVERYGPNGGWAVDG